jgi:NitT/TauT family transport system ATP-binding protein
MDEPTSALDRLTAQNLRAELLEHRLQRSIPTRVLLMVTHNMVTHNIEEAVFVADCILILAPNLGRIRAEVPAPLAHPRA